MNENPGLLNYQWAYAFADTLANLGMQHACISPGSRNTPLTLAFTHHPEITCYSHIDERSSAFFALGLSKVTRIPTILLCTSGTAGANYHPAVIEASYSDVPLLVCTADRPPELHGAGANQTVDQQELYGAAVRWFSDVGLPQESPAEIQRIAHNVFAVLRNGLPGPIHLNFPFRKPLEPKSQSNIANFLQSYRSAKIDTDVPADSTAISPTDAGLDSLTEQLKSASNGLILAGPMDYAPEIKQSILRLADKFGYPILADGLSQLRSDGSKNEYICEYASLFLSDARLFNRAQPDLILRFGRIPTSNILNEFLRKNGATNQILIEPGNRTDATHTLNTHIQADTSSVCGAIQNSLSWTPSQEQTEFASIYTSVNGIAKTTVENFLSSGDSLTELHIFPELLPLVPEQTNLMVSNSMPVRDMDLVGPVVSADYPLHFNRGASGIDGINSTAFGIAAASGKPTALVTGDLAFYHDLNGLLAWKRLRIPLTMILVNNDSGNIFEMLPLSELQDDSFEEYFLTPHGLEFRPFVEEYGGRYTLVESRSEFRDAVNESISAEQLNVIEVRTDGSEAMEARRALHEQVATAIRDSSLLSE